MSGGLFIFASTVLKYILDPEDVEDCRDRLRKVTSTVAKGIAATNTVDKVYELIITEASRSEAVDSDELQRMRCILACILTARISLSVEALSALIDIRPARLRSSLRRLHSIVHVPSDDFEPRLQTLHASFGDYMLERGPDSIRIAPSLGHDILACGCLRRLGWDDLCFNISRSQSSFQPNPDTEPNWIPLSLIYACLNWAHHVDAASITSDFGQEIAQGFRPKFLFWLEVLSVLGKIGLASGLLRIAGSAIRQQETSQFLRDANEFTASSHAAISRSAPHIYISALPFAAKDSLVYRDFVPLCTGLISVATFGIDRHGGGLITTLTGHEDKVNSVAYSPDGHHLASGSHDGTVRIWDVRTGEETVSLQHGEDAVLSVAFAPNGQHIASGTSSGAVNLWSVNTGRAVLEPLYGHVDWVLSVAFSSNGKIIASASFDGTVRLWSSDTGHAISMMHSGHACQVNNAVFSHKGHLLVCASDDRITRLWESRTDESGKDPYILLKEGVTCLAFSADGKYLAAGSRVTDKIRIWDLNSSTPTPTIIENQTATTSLSFSLDGSRLIAAGWQIIRGWNMRNGEAIPVPSLAGHSRWVNAAAFSPDGIFLASGSDDCKIQIWDTFSRSQSAAQPLDGHNSWVASVTVSPNGTFIVSGSNNDSIRVWDTLTGTAKLQLQGHTGTVLAVAVSSNSRLIASASADLTIRIWDAITGNCVCEPLQGHESQVNSVAFSPNLLWLASGSDDNSVRMWHLPTTKAALFGPLRITGTALTVSFSPNGQLLAAAGSGGYVHFWRSGTDNQARSALYADFATIHSVAFSPDSTQIVCGTTERLVMTWNVSDGQQLFLLEGHIDWVRSVSYSPDSRYIVSASDDATVRLWDAKTGQPVSVLFGHGDQVRSVAFTPDGQAIVSASMDWTIHVWDVEAAVSPPSNNKQNSLTALSSARISDGWLMGSSRQLLLWLPVEYRGRIQLPPCSTLIGPHRVVITTEEPGGELNLGDRWTNCWRTSVQQTLPPSQ